MCLKAAANKQMDNLYTTALLSYTFTLAGDEEMRSKLITYLNQASKFESKTGEPSNTFVLVVCFLVTTIDTFAVRWAKKTIKQII